MPPSQDRLQQRRRQRLSTQSTDCSPRSKSRTESVTGTDWIIRRKRQRSNSIFRTKWGVNLVLHRPCLVLSCLLLSALALWRTNIGERETHQQRSLRGETFIQQLLTFRRQHPIDDYYSRQHIRPPENIDISRKPVLVIGGSDGSGTRMFADIMGHLGVPLLVDDKRSLDVHAGKIYQGEGWPGLVQRVLKVTRSANYEYQDLPALLRITAMGMVADLNRRHVLRAMELIRRAQKSNITLPSNVFFGFKAPVSMMALPILRQVYGPIKFLHVIRDGRDVSLSANQSPVAKFYDAFYEDASIRRTLYDIGPPNYDLVDSLRPVMAMQLWNDWNLQVRDWALAHNDGITLDYLAMRAEDLLDPEQKYQSLLQLADFVGSPRSQREICCLSRQTAMDMGESDAITTHSKDSENEHQQNKSPGLYDNLKKLTQSGDNEPIHGSEQRAEQANAEKEDGKVEKVDPSLLMENVSRPSQKVKVAEILKRYGKWRTKLQGKDNLSGLLHSKGREALRYFGYLTDESTNANPRPFRDNAPPELLSFQCDSSVICDDDEPTAV